MPHSLLSALLRSLGLNDPRRLESEDPARLCQDEPHSGGSGGPIRRYYDPLDLFDRHNFGRDVKRNVEAGEWVVVDGKPMLTAHGIVQFSFRKRVKTVTSLILNLLDAPSPLPRASARTASSPQASKRSFDEYSGSSHAEPPPLSALEQQLQETHLNSRSNSLSLSNTDMMDVTTLSSPYPSSGDFSINDAPTSAQFLGTGVTGGGGPSGAFIHSHSLSGSASSHIHPSQRTHMRRYQPPYGPNSAYRSSSSHSHSHSRSQSHSHSLSHSNSRTLLSEVKEEPHSLHLHHSQTVSPSLPYLLPEQQPHLFQPLQYHHPLQQQQLSHSSHSRSHSRSHHQSLPISHPHTPSSPSFSHGSPGGYSSPGTLPSPDTFHSDELPFLSPHDGVDPLSLASPLPLSSSHSSMSSSSKHSASAKIAHASSHVSSSVSQSNPKQSSNTFTFFPEPEVDNGVYDTTESALVRTTPLNTYRTTMALDLLKAHGEFLVSSSPNETINIWKLNPHTSNLELKKSFTETHRATEFLFCQTLAYSYSSGSPTFMSFYLDRLRRGPSFKGHTGNVEQIVIDNRASGSPHTIYSVAADQTLRCWNANGEQHSATSLTSVASAVVCYGHYVITAQSTQVCIWEKLTLTLKHKLDISAMVSPQLCFDPRVKRVFVYDRTGLLVGWRLKDFRLCCNLNFNVPVVSLAITKKYFILSGVQTVSIYNHAGLLLDSIPGTRTHLENGYLCVAQKATMTVWKLKSRKKFAIYPSLSQIVSLTSSPEGFFCADSSGDIQRWRNEFDVVGGGGANTKSGGSGIIDGEVRWENSSMRGGYF